MNRMKIVDLLRYILKMHLKMACEWVFFFCFSFSSSFFWFFFFQWKTILILQDCNLCPMTFNQPFSSVPSLFFIKLIIFPLNWYRIRWTMNHFQKSSFFYSFSVSFETLTDKSIEKMLRKVWEAAQPFIIYIFFLFVGSGQKKINETLNLQNKKTYRHIQKYCFYLKKKKEEKSTES